MHPDPLSFPLKHKNIDFPRLQPYVTHLFVVINASLSESVTGTRPFCLCDTLVPKLNPLLLSLPGDIIPLASSRVGGTSPPFFSSSKWRADEKPFLRSVWELISAVPLRPPQRGRNDQSLYSFQDQEVSSAVTPHCVSAFTPIT